MHYSIPARMNTYDRSSAFGGTCRFFTISFGLLSPRFPANNSYTFSEETSILVPTKINFVDSTLTERTYSQGLFLE